MEAFIRKHYQEVITNALKSNNKQIKINFDLTNLFSENAELFNLMHYRFDEEHDKWKREVMKQVVQIEQAENIQYSSAKIEINFEFSNHPRKVDWPTISRDMNKLIEFKGYVFRISTPKKIEMIREVMCTKCRQKTTIKATRQYDYAFECSRKCFISHDCDGKMVYTKKQEEIPPLENTIDYQVFKIQELDKFTPKNRYYSVEVVEKLVDYCSIGDTVHVIGTLETRNDLNTKEIKRIVIRAVSISKPFEIKDSVNSSEMEATYTTWINNKKLNNDDELDARNEMLKAVAPELKNCYILKLALLIVLCTGGRSKLFKRTQRLERMTNRDISHLLFIGLPGLGKSQLLKAASKLSNRAIKCVGSACTLAGLTASSYKEDGETHVEAGALVLANHGICCIDEFNLLSTRNRGALHDAMEHQKFSFMQANLKVEINARCSVIASMNHKAEQTAEARNRSIKNAPFNIEPSLISRFDFAFFLEKPEDPQFDLDIVDAILAGSLCTFQEVVNQWSMEMLQLHVIAAKNLSCELTPNCMKLLFNYYRFCDACEGVDGSRKTMRLLKSLERLTIGHAKLLFRNKTKLIDALTVIWLTENSWSFGDLVSQENVVMSDLPVGPSQKCIQHIFNTLRLGELYEVFVDEQQQVETEMMHFETTIREDKKIDGSKRELKKLFNKTIGLKRRSNEKKSHEKTIMDDELPDELKKSFAINNLNDLFDNDDGDGEDHRMQTEQQAYPGNNQLDTQIDSENMEMMENYFLNEMDDEIENFVICNENMSTQRSEMQQCQPSTSNAAIVRDNMNKNTLGNLLVRKTLQSSSSNQRKLSSDDEDLFAVFTDEILNKKSKNDELTTFKSVQTGKSSAREPKSVPEKQQQAVWASLPPNSTNKTTSLTEKSPNVLSKQPEAANKPKSTLAFLGRLKNFEYESQSSEMTEPAANENKNAQKSSSTLSDSLMALSNQLTGNRQPKMSHEEYLKALDNEMDLWS